MKVCLTPSSPPANSPSASTHSPVTFSRSCLCICSLKLTSNKEDWFWESLCVLEFPWLMGYCSCLSTIAQEALPSLGSLSCYLPDEIVHKIITMIVKGVSTDRRYWWDYQIPWACPTSLGVACRGGLAGLSDCPMNGHWYKLASVCHGRSVDRQWAPVIFYM